MRGNLANLGMYAARAARLARTGAEVVIARAPRAARATRTGAGGTTSALQKLPDPVLRWLAAGSVGLGAGLSLAGAPRVVVAAGVAPALIIGAAIASRPVARRAES
ncbi:MAG: hypothetical protein P4L30_09465 [Candidatus Limnocylindrales bacterium]|nr:hypothetical protein [Candidatus Limnocylindrales bacterium]